MEAKATAVRARWLFAGEKMRVCPWRTRGGNIRRITESELMSLATAHGRGCEADRLGRGAQRKDSQMPRVFTWSMRNGEHGRTLREGKIRCISELLHAKPMEQLR